ncbi:(2Fe-2S)-binding protein [Bacillus sp. B15-48]|uniref:(2Fe-2S)-binding protein n=1 Tax=Bacillus sp. B15-48 TaxID=1548601 RepID=UPI00193F1D69|nr:(2Fe-2S)-binding protein [Bacillus sp. B15-48]MBM4761868.1 2Fe-2S iron-sulfur cluster binding domain-containing protein [Bacillus sp. B15-48]
MARLNVNGQKRDVIISQSERLLTTLRHLQLTGTKPGCYNGDCGACTVMVDHQPYKSCIMLSVEVMDRNITTIEGLNNVPIQTAFVEHFAFQCGYCTPGFIMNAHSLIINHPDATDSLIEEWLKSNICRCTSYEEIERAVKSVLGKGDG